MFFNQNLEGVCNTLKEDIIGMYIMHDSAIVTNPGFSFRLSFDCIYTWKPSR